MQSKSPFLFLVFTELFENLLLLPIKLFEQFYFLQITSALQHNHYKKLDINVLTLNLNCFSKNRHKLLQMSIRTYLFVK